MLSLLMPDPGLLVLADYCRRSGLFLETTYLQKHDFLSLTADTIDLHLWMETLHGDLEVLLVIPLKKETL